MLRGPLFSVNPPQAVPAAGADTLLGTVEGAEASYYCPWSTLSGGKNLSVLRSRTV